MKLDHDRTNGLTEIDRNFQRYNPYLLDALSALHPACKAKLSTIIFNIIIATKRNHPKQSRYFSEVENKRIHSNRYVSLEDILDRYHPAKYTVEGKDTKKDISNLMKHLKWLDDNNIFHIWRYGSPYTYQFIMERDIGVWKYYNEWGVVTPKTLKKVIKASNGMIDSMVRMGKSRGRIISLKDIELSFVNDFVRNLVGKMNKEVAKDLPLWDGKQTIANYLTELRTELDMLDDYEGLEHHPDFYQRLPKHIREKINDEKEENMNIAQLSMDLIPKDESVIKNKVIRTRKRKSSPQDSIKAKRTAFKAVDPFANCHQFMKYYRDVISLYNQNARFYPQDSERAYATQIMDMLIEGGKESDKDFLINWIRYYIGSCLQGNNAKKQEKTSLNNFKKTFKAYEGKSFKG